MHDRTNLDRYTYLTTRSLFPSCGTFFAAIVMRRLMPCFSPDELGLPAARSLTTACL